MYIRSAAEAEANAALRMRDLGFSDVKVGAGGPDGGIDVRADEAVAQVKWRGAAASRPELQNLYGARGPDHSKEMLFFAASTYTKGAVEYADAVDMALFVYDPDGTTRSANGIAFGMIKRADEAARAAEQASFDAEVAAYVAEALESQEYVKIDPSPTPYPPKPDVHPNPVFRPPVLPWPATPVFKPPVIEPVALPKLAQSATTSLALAVFCYLLGALASVVGLMCIGFALTGNEGMTGTRGGALILGIALLGSAIILFVLGRRADN